MQIIIQAIIDDSLNILIDELDKLQVSVNSILHNQLTLLQLAAKAGHLNIIRELIIRGADINAKTKLRIEDSDHSSSFDITPLYLALEHGHLYAAGLLILCGANIEDTLAIAALMRHEKVISMLPIILEHYCDPYPHFCWSLQQASPELFEILIKCNPLKDHKLNYALLCLAACNNYFDSAKLLLEAHVPCDNDSFDRTPLYWAILSDKILRDKISRVKILQDKKKLTNLLINKYKADVKKAIVQLLRDGERNDSCLDLMRNYTTRELYTSTFPEPLMTLHILESSRDNIDTLSDMQLSIDDYNELYHHALSQNNLIVLQSLIKLPKRERFYDIIKLLMKNSNFNQLKFIFAYVYTLYGTYKHLEHNNEDTNIVFDYLKKHPKEQNSFIYLCLKNNEGYIIRQLLHSADVQSIVNEFLYLAIKYNDIALAENCLSAYPHINYAITYAKQENNGILITRLEETNKVYQRKTASYLLNLPTCILIEILKYLSVHDRNRVSLTCKYYLSLINPYTTLEALRVLREHRTITKKLINRITQCQDDRSRYFTKSGFEHIWSYSITTNQYFIGLMLCLSLTYPTWRWALSQEQKKDASAVSIFTSVLLIIFISLASLAGLVGLVIAGGELLSFPYKYRNIKDMGKNENLLYLKLLPHYPEINANLTQHNIAELLKKLKTLCKNISEKIKRLRILHEMPSYKNYQQAFLADTNKFFKPKPNESKSKSNHDMAVGAPATASINKF